MEFINIAISTVQVTFLLSVLYGLIFKRVYMFGRWVYCSEGREYWYALIFQSFALFMFTYFFGWLPFFAGNQ